MNRWESLIDDALAASSRREYHVAEEFFSEALKEAEQSNSRPVLVSLTLEHLADLCMATQRPELAEKHYRRVLEIREQFLGEAHHKVAKTLFDLATICFTDDRPKEAEDFYVRSLAVAKKALGPEDEDVAAIQQSIGIFYNMQERYTEAAQHLRDAIEIRKKSGSNPYDVMAAQGAYAESLEGAGELDEATQVHEQILAAKESQLGPSHAALMVTLQSLSNLYEQKEDIRRGIECEQRVLEIQTGALGQTHAATIDTYRNLGRYQVLAEDYSEAAKMYERSVQCQEANYGKDHPSLLDDLEYLIELYDYIGDDAKVEKLTARCDKIRSKL